MKMYKPIRMHQIPRKYAFLNLAIGIAATAGVFSTMFKNDKTQIEQVLETHINESIKINLETVANASMMSKTEQITEIEGDLNASIYQGSSTKTSNMSDLTAIKNDQYKNQVETAQDQMIDEKIKSDAFSSQQENVKRQVTQFFKELTKTVNNSVRNTASVYSNAIQAIKVGGNVNAPIIQTLDQELFQNLVVEDVFKTEAMGEIYAELDSDITSARQGTVATVSDYLTDKWTAIGDAVGVGVKGVACLFKSAACSDGSSGNVAGENVAAQHQATEQDDDSGISTLISIIVGCIILAIIIYLLWKLMKRPKVEEHGPLGYPPHL